MGTLRRVIVGVDGSDGARHALQWAAGLVEGSTCEIIAVHALGLLTHLSQTSVVPSASLRDDVIRHLEEEWCRPLAESGVRYRTVTMDGEPVHVLLEAAREQGADLVVVGRRGAGGHPGLAIGSASQQLVHQADLPVVVVPPERSEQDPGSN